MKADENARPLPTYDYKFKGPDALKALSEQQRIIGRTLERITDEQARSSYAPGKWSIKELLGHMVDTERIMVFRALSFARGETAELPGFDEDMYVANAHFNRQPLAQLLIQYHSQRTATVHLFASFTEEMYSRRGVANGKERSVREIMETIAAHELHHLNVLQERYLTMWH